VPDEMTGESRFKRGGTCPFVSFLYFRGRESPECRYRVVSSSLSEDSEPREVGRREELRCELIRFLFAMSGAFRFF